ncbi:MAG TPA: bifunctional homocysteine S-methyltransferase/methylenetetrahydrofolate reductase [Syntrophales bacterium]|jgi:homocysteine S-methyltransferase|nr:bifunctional homocysteine S-methyltransferase/methylenetetrahydrofolate reductase [Syntrophales bacterium]HOU77928.1 bifunctional homocysteine S-methyltransferase/methylenetetrahydrofolate reductase [Syntrophales bacterium]HPC32535.1 bifunctional homocysteine S-methyltransferase/methylenetetrahydrofolate reductase [Syntrophales bacterium]HQG34093.1 bifunctional homocysteine S-methyltransferase/methylenetetrahydrofolate reductase [Syntrophales bacterium]HQI35871.1 bifunctional homocysteine S-
MTDKVTLKEYAREHLIVGDGAMATWLHQQGVPIGTCCEELNLSRPELIREIHREYYEAGARLIETNTFGANRDALSHHGLEDSVYRINWKAASLAREAVGPDAWVAGSMTGISARRVRHEALPGHREIFVEQAEALLAGGVHVLILETFLDLAELLLALQAVRPLTDLPIITQLACMEVGKTRDGFSVTESFRLLTDAGADILGLNCRLGPAELLRTLEQTIVPEGAILSVFPNAGRLGLMEGEFGYTSSPAYFAARARRFRDQGIRIIGGCCGTTPEHIRAVADALNGLNPSTRINPEQIPVAEPAPAPRPAVPGRGITDTILDRVRQRPTVLVEFDPPKDLDIERYLIGAASLQDAGADFITMADNSLAQTRMSNLALGAIVKMRLGIDPLVHIACRDRNLIGQQSHLMGLHALGIHQILVITGDPARFGDLPGASSVFDVSSFDLIRMVKQLNAGISFSGQPLRERGRFVVGAAFNPHVANLDSACKRLEKKIEAGADFILTQPVYDRETIEMIAERTRHLPVPVFIGIMPITSGRNAEFLHNEVPGIRLTDAVRQRMGKYPAAGPDARREGLDLARELLDIARECFRGLYLMTPFSYYELTAALTRHVKGKTGNGVRQSSPAGKPGP